MTFRAYRYYYKISTITNATIIVVVDIVTIIFFLFIFKYMVIVMVVVVITFITTIMEIIMAVIMVIVVIIRITVLVSVVMTMMMMMMVMLVIILLCPRTIKSLLWSLAESIFGPSWMTLCARSYFGKYSVIVHNITNLFVNVCLEVRCLSSPFFYYI